MRVSSLTLLSVLLGASCSVSFGWTTVSRPSVSVSSSRRRIAPLYASVEDKVSSSSPSSSSTPKAAATSGDEMPFLPLNEHYRNARDQMLAILKHKIPEEYHGRMMPMLTHFAGEYMYGTQKSAADGNKVSEAASTHPKAAMERFLKAIQLGLTYGNPKSPDLYTFEVSHTAMRGNEIGFGKTDFYTFGNRFFEPFMDLDREHPETHILGMDNLNKAMQQAAAGDNVVFFANHQSEADPQVVSCCMELVGKLHEEEDMIYIAGHKVTTDILAIPFSMGRNLICIHSKKHIDADRATKPIKQRQNLKAMNALLRKFKAGGAKVWVAPSGGRDRRDLTTGKVPIAPFDSKTIDMFRLMGQKSGVTTHYYTMAMVTYELCPPPDSVEAGTGEARNIRYVPVGIAIGDELENTGGLETRHEFSDLAMQQCAKDYKKLEETLEKYANSKKK